MKTIYKYVLNPNDPSIMVPKGATLLCAHEQYGNICIWAEIDPDVETERRNLYVYGTGHSMSTNSQRYIGTVFLDNVSLVFHIYEQA